MLYINTKMQEIREQVYMLCQTNNNNGSKNFYLSWCFSFQCVSCVENAWLNYLLYCIASEMGHRLWISKVKTRNREYEPNKCCLI